MNHHNANEHNDLGLPNRVFPFDVFPPFLRSYICHLHRSCGTAIEHVAAGVLFAASSAAGCTHELALKSGHLYSGQLFLGLVGPPKTSKAAALCRPLAPILTQDYQNFQDYQKQIQEHLQSKKSLSTVPEKTIVQDLRPESLAALIEQNERGITLCHMDLQFWLKSFRREKASTFWRAAWSGRLLWSSTSYERKISSYAPYIPVAGIIRTSVLDQQLRKGQISDELMSRLILVRSNRPQQPSAKGIAIPQSLEDHYDTGIKKLLHLRLGAEGQAQVIRTEQEALRKFVNFFNGVIRSKTPYMTRHFYLDVHTARCCLLLQLLWWAFAGIEKDLVKPTMTERAIRLVNYFEDQKRRILWPYISPAKKQLSRDRQAVYEALPDSFTLGEGVEIARRRKMKKRTFQRFLTKDDLFSKVGHGVYEKANR